MFARFPCRLGACLLAVILASAACGLPRDPEGTLERVRGGVLRAGLVAHDPWVLLHDEGPAGIEVRLLEEFAATIDATVEWFPAAESEVVEALHQGELDVVAGGLTSTSPHAGMAALTHPFLTTQTIVGFPPESGIDPDIEGLEVAVESGTAAAGLLEKTDAIPVPVDDIASAPGARVIESWMLEDLDLVDLGVRLEERDHVLAVRLGENDFMVELESFLLSHTGLIEQLVDEAQP